MIDNLRWLSDALYYESGLRAGPGHQPRIGTAHARSYRYFEAQHAYVVIPSYSRVLPREFLFSDMNMTIEDLPFFYIDDDQVHFMFPYGGTKLLMSCENPEMANIIAEKLNAGMRAAKIEIMAQGESLQE